MGNARSEYRKKDIAFAQGDPADTVFYIKRGQIKLTVVSDRGSRRS
jgi:CRP/FNR family cyclic AMP-dependent transcriptional regulator